MKFILICATGRDGSTTLQRIINSIPNSNITGEKSGAIENLLLCYKNIKYTTKMTPTKYNIFLSYDKIKNKNIKPSWYNSYDYKEVINNIKNTIISILINNSNKELQILGYKEIRWFNNLDLLDEFLELFPNTKIICHLSDNLDKQIQSGWWKKDLDLSREYLSKYNEQLITYASKNKNCYLSYMKNLFNIDEIKKIFLFLDEPFDEKEYNFIINNNLKD